jgi:hypothetical protein
MARNQLRSDDIEGFMVAVWDSWIDLQEEFGVIIGVGAVCQRERGHITFRASAYRKQTDGSEKRVAAAERAWPGHHAKSVHAMLYSLLIGLWRELNDERRDRELSEQPPTN